MTTPASVGDLDLGDAAFGARIRTDLDRVERALREAVRSDEPVVAEPAAHLVAAGGKRFRPLVVLLAAHFGDPAGYGVIPSAVVVELTHLATLYHDDVMDEAAVRRGVPSANARWDNSVAILTGDFLFARASDILADLGPAAVRLLARTFGRIVTGQILEGAAPAPGVDPVEHYLKVLDAKTGSLIATSARFGATFGGLEPGLGDRLQKFGELIGTAFQLSDDLLDIASEAGESGKLPGTDLREGVRTLPVLYALRSSSTAAQEVRLRSLLSRPLATDAPLAEALGLLRVSPAMAEARATVLDYAARARELLAGLPAVPARAAFVKVTDYLVDRAG